MFSALLSFPFATKLLRRVSPSESYSTYQTPTASSGEAAGICAFWVTRPKRLANGLGGSHGAHFAGSEKYHKRGSVGTRRSGSARAATPFLWRGCECFVSLVGVLWSEFGRGREGSYDWFDFLIRAVWCLFWMGKAFSIGNTTGKAEQAKSNEHQSTSFERMSFCQSLRLQQEQQPSRWSCKWWGWRRLRLSRWLPIAKRWTMWMITDADHRPHRPH